MLLFILSLSMFCIVQKLQIIIPAYTVLQSTQDSSHVQNNRQKDVVFVTNEIEVLNLKSWLKFRITTHHSLSEMALFYAYYISRIQMEGRWQVTKLKHTVLKSILSDIFATLAFLNFLFAWNILFYPLSFILCVSLGLK